MRRRLLVIDVKDYANDFMLFWITIVQVSLWDFNNKLIVEDDQVCHKSILEFVGGPTHWVFFFLRFDVIFTDLFERGRVFHVLEFIGMQSLLL